MASLDPAMLEMETFQQILDLDDDDERSFSRNIVHGFFEQAEQTFNEMDMYIQKKDLPKLSSLGHFLKGSSATLGLIKLKDSCERIQNLGTTREGKAEEQILKDMEATLVTMKHDYKQVKMTLGTLYPSIPK